MRRRTYFIKTYGCQMNVYDSAKLAEVLEVAGYQSIRISERDNQKSEYQKADVILVNTCCVRQHAENRALGFISSLKYLKKQNPNLVIGIGGCIPKEDRIDLGARFPFVDLIFGPNEPEKLREFLGRKSKVDSRKLKVGNGFVTIIHGCNNFCSYCIVPYVRGREFSRPIAEVLAEVKGLIEQGTTDITLLGQNVNSYKYGLANLLREIDKIPSTNYKIHFLTCHPRDMSDEIIQAVYQLPYIAKEFHLPVQSGDDEILEKMNRGYTVDYYRNLIAKIRSLMPEARITTDVIVGFPAETQEQFENTLNLIREIKFNAVNMAAYSLRMQTAAAKMSGQLPEEVKQKRLEKLIQVVKEIVRCYNPNPNPQRKGE